MRDDRRRCVYCGRERDWREVDSFVGGPICRECQDRAREDEERSQREIERLYPWRARL